MIIRCLSNILKFLIMGNNETLKEEKFWWIVLYVAIAFLFGTFIWFGGAFILAAVLSIIFIKRKKLQWLDLLSPWEIMAFFLTSVIFAALLYYSIAQWIVSGEVWVFPWISIFIWELYFLWACYYLQNFNKIILPSKPTIFLGCIGLLLSFWYVIYTQYFFAWANMFMLFVVNALYISSFKHDWFSLKNWYRAAASYFSSSLYVYDSVRILKDASKLKQSFSFIKNCMTYLVTVSYFSSGFSFITFCW